jgi:putative ABC transport system permease protein
MLKHYLSLSLKVFSRRKAFTCISLFGISFTLVVLTVATAMLDSTFAPRAPESRQDRMLVNFFAVMYGPNGGWYSPAGYRLFDQQARGLPAVERLSISSTGGSVVSYVNAAKITSALKRTDGEFWRVYDFQFIEGAPYTSRDVDEARFVAVINQTTCRKFFGLQSSCVGRTIEADGQRFRVLGVVADVAFMRFMPFSDIWVPLTTAKSDAYRRDLMGNFQVTVLARDRSAFQSIREEFASRLTRVELPDRRFTTIVAPLETRFDAVARMTPIAQRREPLSQGWKLRVLLVVLTVLFMLLPAVNLVNLNVSRVMERSSEIGMRKAFGASSMTLVGQFVFENVLLTIIGGTLGLAIADVALRVLNSSGAIPYADFTVNHRVFLYGLVLAIVFGLLSGVYPAWRMARLQPVAALKGGGR